MESFEYISRALNIGPRVRADIRYPVGEPFGEFYAELAEKCLEFTAREYAEYAGRGIFYRAVFDVVYAGEVVSVVGDISVRERGVGIVKKRVMAQNFLPDGRLLPMTRIFGKKGRATSKCGTGEYCVLGGSVFAIEKNGEKTDTGVKFVDFSILFL